MDKVLLDTDIFSEILKGVNQHVVAKALLTVKREALTESERECSFADLEAEVGRWTVAQPKDQ